MFRINETVMYNSQTITLYEKKKYLWMISPVTHILLLEIQKAKIEEEKSPSNERRGEKEKNQLNIWIEPDLRTIQRLAKTYYSFLSASVSWTQFKCILKWNRVASPNFVPFVLQEK